MITSPSSGSCPRRPFSRTAAPTAACRFPASSTKPRTASKAYRRALERKCLARLAIGGGIGSYWGNLSAPSAKKSAATARPPASCPSSASWTAHARDLPRFAAPRLRRNYLPIWHPEIEEFIEIRRPTGGDPNRKALNLHHGVLVNDAFMRAVENDEEWALKSPERQSRRR
jgi:hypothetical protein